MIVWSLSGLLPLVPHPARNRIFQRLNIQVSSGNILNPGFPLMCVCARAFVCVWVCVLLGEACWHYMRTSRVFLSCGWCDHTQIYFLTLHLSPAPYTAELSSPDEVAGNVQSGRSMLLSWDLKTSCISDITGHYGSHHSDTTVVLSVHSQHKRTGSLWDCI